jgi:hypothetical protein
MARLLSDHYGCFRSYYASDFETRSGVAATQMSARTKSQQLDGVDAKKNGLDENPGKELGETKSARLDAVRFEIERAREDLLGEKQRLMQVRAELELQMSALEAELRILDSLGKASISTGKPVEPACSGLGRRKPPLNQRVLEILRHNESRLTSRQIRELLDLDYKESRNLGPILNQLAKLGKISNDGRGAPWKLLQRGSHSTAS